MTDKLSCCVGLAWPCDYIIRVIRVVGVARNSKERFLGPDEVNIIYI